MQLFVLDMCVTAAEYSNLEGSLILVGKFLVSKQIPIWNKDAIFDLLVVNTTHAIAVIHRMLQSAEIYEMKKNGRRVYKARLLELPPPPNAIPAAITESVVNILQQITGQNKTIDIFQRPTLTIVIYDERDADMTT